MKNGMTLILLALLGFLVFKMMAKDGKATTEDNPDKASDPNSGRQNAASPNLLDSVVTAVNSIFALGESIAQSAPRNT